MFDDDNLTVEEAAKYLKVHPESLRRMARSGGMPGFKVGTHWRFSRRELDAWSKDGGTKAATRRILLVDDEDSVRKMACRALEGAGYEVVMADGGEAALESVGRDSFDLIFLDLRMSGMDGPAVLKHVRAQWKDLPVVIFTAYPDSEWMEEALAYSPFVVVKKPAGLEEIVSAADTVLKRNAK